MKDTPPHIRRAAARVKSALRLRMSRTGSAWQRVQAFGREVLDPAQADAQFGPEAPGGLVQLDPRAAFAQVQIDAQLHHQHPQEHPHDGDGQATDTESGLEQGGLALVSVADPIRERQGVGQDHGREAVARADRAHGVDIFPCGCGGMRTG
ncbi:hypothetical protein [Paracoccus mutanolyticus]|uniref:hypothetical protein n=1 Tax=Paracoccus mutanolyticus TaxID=1499308 RepID=UPI001CB99693|nr:hypothetical protein [Paracoccus mutanolyticus]